MNIKRKTRKLLKGGSLSIEIPYFVVINSDEREYYNTIFDFALKHNTGLSISSVFSGKNKNLPHFAPEINKYITSFSNHDDDTLKNTLELKVTNDVFEDFCNSNDINNIVTTPNGSEQSIIQELKNYCESFDIICKAFINNIWVNININYNIMYLLYLEQRRN